VLVAPGHELKEQHRAGAADREIANLINDEHGRMGEDLQAGLEPAGRLRLFQRGNQIRERAAVDAAPALRGGERRR
jgi:hypothetical protein